MAQVALQQTTQRRPRTAAPALELVRGVERTPRLADQRFDMYVLIHKGLRNFMTGTLAAVGRMDVYDDAEVTATLAQVHELLALCRLHARLEDRFLHIAMEARRAGSSVQAAKDHEHHGLAIEALEFQVSDVERSGGEARAGAALALYHRLALFVAENFEHMDLEETEHNAALWATHSDEELIALHEALVRSVSPKETAVVLRWIIPSITPTERAAMLSDMQRKAPTEVFRGVLALVKPLLSERDWTKLMAAIGPAPIGA